MSSAIRSSIRNSGKIAQKLAVQSQTRSYVDRKAPMSHGGNNRNIIIALVGITLPALYIYTQRSTQESAAVIRPDNVHKIAAPELDPAGRTKMKREAEAAGNGAPKHTHPEHEDPDTFKPPFGQLHQRKRVDGPPDGRNHQELNERNKQI